MDNSAGRRLSHGQPSRRLAGETDHRMPVPGPRHSGGWRLRVHGRVRTVLRRSATHPVRPAAQKPQAQRQRRTGTVNLAIRILCVPRTAHRSRPTAGRGRSLRRAFQPHQAPTKRLATLLQPSISPNAAKEIPPRLTCAEPGQELDEFGFRHIVNDPGHMCVRVSTNSVTCAPITRLGRFFLSDSGHGGSL